MKKVKFLFVFLSVIGFTFPLLGQKKVSDLKFHHMQNYCWMRFAEIVPEVTDRVILPIGTVEAHGATAIGSDNLIPINLSERMWEKCNALIAPTVNYGFTGQTIARFPGSITIREDIYTEYLYDIMKDLVRSGFQYILVVNGHGGNANAAREAAKRVHLETAAKIMVVEWWNVGREIGEQIYNTPPHEPGHAALEESALVLSYNQDLVDREMVEKLGKDNVASHRLEEGFGVFPYTATMFLYDKDKGYLNFDLKKAEEYTNRMADYISDAFLEAVKRWEMMESWK